MDLGSAESQAFPNKTWVLLPDFEGSEASLLDDGF